MIGRILRYMDQRLRNEAQALRNSNEITTLRRKEHERFMADSELFAKDSVRITSLEIRLAELEAQVEEGRRST